MAELVKFTEKTIDYAKNPRNQGDMENPTAIGEVSNPDCGDSTIIYLKVEDNIIKDVTFETFGCAAAVASSSMLTEMIKGKTIEEAYAMTEEAVAEELGGLPDKKMHCSVIGVEAMRKAIQNYRNGVVRSDED
ncbi:MAG: iron-sulfur cluster assembly scaffold protein [Peptococcaceae bacterium]|jgi:nitrogen fixation NifU-like protein|nr:iron-sulfur cluster assembly scaffold protein [Peptococcaceae bacterium]MBQ2003535.1 iron-sulfur cluster assembly scaffold protein [Peptococcaceae bacterium]MBQ2021971.1 iron-sulfur cluster assembly scaffold protein [Peptococcaceae bacterium]MBQ2370217.1 iron-sulfur cluster assembly scaffold protein [Peptococcaceae bacterium]MBQ2431704.1 iron-sulfur cluster assembly scaffold protein [Peptococcaceae bacterium]